MTGLELKQLRESAGVPLAEMEQALQEFGFCVIFIHRLGRYEAGEIKIPVGMEKAARSILDPPKVQTPTRRSGNPFLCKDLFKLMQEDYIINRHYTDRDDREKYGGNVFRRISEQLGPFFDNIPAEELSTAQIGEYRSMRRRQLWFLRNS